MNHDSDAAQPRLHSGPLRLADFLTDAAPPDCGALAIFAGTVRNSHEGRAVKGIHYHAYPPLAERRLLEIEAEAEHRCAGRVRVAHAMGELGVGDISVVVVVHAGHRAGAFETCRWTIDTIKLAVPIWKEERYVEGDSRFLDGSPLQDVPRNNTPENNAR
jgi:molybdopterin synthase catalytic subunit